MVKIHVTTKLYLVAFMFLCSSQFNFAQEGEQPKFNISIAKGSLTTALEQIDEIQGVILSYDPTLFIDRTVEAQSFSDATLAAILNGVLGSDFGVEMDGNYAIIQPATKAVSKKPIPREKKNLATISIKSLSVNKEEIKNPSSSEVFTRMEAESKDGKHVLLEEEPATSVNSVSAKDTSNIDPEKNRHQLIQVSLLPGIGTSAPNSSEVDINYSFNLLGGKHHSLEGVEFGGIYNQHISHAYGFQTALLGNFVGNDAKGFQVAGLINQTKEGIRGLQFSGLANLNSGALEGVQVSGLFNTTLTDATGSQLAFGGNIMKGNLTGGQVSFVGNAIQGHLNGPQLAFGANIVRDSLRGIQVGGAFNSARHVKGAQLSMGINIVREKTTGFQLGAFNKTGKLSGIQMGVINVVDSLEKGATIGLINLVKNGKTELGIDHNDVDHVRLSFRTGTNGFYNIYNAGFRLLESDASGDDNLLVSYGFGFGTEKSLAKHLFLNVELTSNLLYNTEDKEQLFNLLNRVQMNIGFRALKRLSFTGGPVLNIFITDEFNSESGETAQLGNKKSFFDKQSSDTLVKMWLGYSFAIKF